MTDTTTTPTPTLLGHMATAINLLRSTMTLHDDQTAELDAAVVALRDSEANMQASIKGAVDAAIAAGLDDYSERHNEEISALNARVTSLEQQVLALQTQIAADDKAASDALAALDGAPAAEPPLEDGLTSAASDTLVGGGAQEAPPASEFTAGGDTLQGAGVTASGAADQGDGNATTAASVQGDPGTGTVTQENDTTQTGT